MHPMAQSELMIAALLQQKMLEDMQQQPPPQPPAPQPPPPAGGAPPTTGADGAGASTSSANGSQAPQPSTSTGGTTGGSGSGTGKKSAIQAFSTLTSSTTGPYCIPPSTFDKLKGLQSAKEFWGGKDIPVGLLPLVKVPAKPPLPKFDFAPDYVMPKKLETDKTLEADKTPNISSDETLAMLQKAFANSVLVAAVPEGVVEEHLEEEEEEEVLVDVETIGPDQTDYSLRGPNCKPAKL